MAEYTVTYPVHLGQTVWVDTEALPVQDRNRLSFVPKYLKGEICALIVQTKGKTERKSIKFRIEANWRDVATKQYKPSYNHFKMSVGSLGKTVFVENPEEV